MLASPRATRFVADLLDAGDAFRATFDLPSAHQVVVLLHVVPPSAHQGRATTAYRTQVTCAGVSVLDAMMACPVRPDAACAPGRGHRSRPP